MGLLNEEVDLRPIYLLHDSPCPFGEDYYGRVILESQWAVAGKVL